MGWQNDHLRLVVAFLALIPSVPGNILPEHQLNVRSDRQQHGILLRPQSRVEVLRGQSQDTVPRGQSQDTVTRGQSQDTVTRVQSQDKVTRVQSQVTVTRGQSQDTVTRVQSQDTVTRGQSHDTVTRGQSQATVTRGQSQATVTRGQSQATVTRGQSQDTVIRDQSQDTVPRGQSQDTFSKIKLQEILTGFQTSQDGGIVLPPISGITGNETRGTAQIETFSNSTIITKKIKTVPQSQANIRKSAQSSIESDTSTSPTNGAATNEISNKSTHLPSTGQIGTFITTIEPPEPQIQQEEPLILSDLNVKEARGRSKVFLSELELTSHAGFITVDYQFRNHLFFWLLDAQQNPDTAPLLIWLSGGLGLSSMTGLLWNHGPFGVEYADVSGQRVRAFKRESFWAKRFSVLYIDSPVGTGYSFSEQGKSGYRSTTTEVTLDLFAFLIEFVYIFPEFKKRDVYFGGQSYAAKYAVSLAQWIHIQTGGRPNFIPLRGIFLSAPLFDPASQMVAVLNAKYNSGALSFADRQMYVQSLLAAFERYEDGSQEKRLKLSSLINSFLPSKLKRMNFDNYVTGVREDNILIQQFMTLRRVRAALHVGHATEFSNVNIDVYDKFGNDFFLNVREKLAKLMEHYKVLIYSGDYDFSIHNSGLEAAILNLPWSHMKAYINATRHVWYGADNTLNGFYTGVGQFCRCVIHGAGHQAAHDRPQVLARLISDFVDGGCVHDHNKLWGISLNTLTHH